MRQFMNKGKVPFDGFQHGPYIMVRESEFKWYALHENGEIVDTNAYDQYIQYWYELKPEEFWPLRNENTVGRYGLEPHEAKKCLCEMSDLLRYGCKCGGI